MPYTIRSQTVNEIFREGFLDALAVIIAQGTAEQRETLRKAWLDLAEFNEGDESQYGMPNLHCIRGVIEASTQPQETARTAR